ncbi:MAG: thiolase family protein, partial [Novosphingobium sp.]
MSELPEKLCRVTGIGQSEVGRPSAKSPIELTLDAAHMAIADAGLRVEDIDGIVNYPPKTDLGGGISPVGVNEAMFALGIDATWIGVANHEGPGHMGAV